MGVHEFDKCVVVRFEVLTVVTVKLLRVSAYSLFLKMETIHSFRK
jgi:hypothetical protein